METKNSILVNRRPKSNLLKLCSKVVLLSNTSTGHYKNILLLELFNNFWIMTKIDFKKFLENNLFDIYCGSL